MAKVAKMSQSLNTQKKAAEKQKCKKMKEKLKKRRRLSEALTVCWGLQATTKRLEGRKTITEANAPEYASLRPNGAPIQLPSSLKKEQTTRHRLVKYLKLKDKEKLGKKDRENRSPTK